MVPNTDNKSQISTATPRARTGQSTLGRLEAEDARQKAEHSIEVRSDERPWLCSGGARRMRVNGWLKEEPTFPAKSIASQEIPGYAGCIY